MISIGRLVVRFALRRLDSAKSKVYLGEFVVNARNSIRRQRDRRLTVYVHARSSWLYFRFALSFRVVEEMIAMRGVALGYEMIRERCLKFGQIYANDLRRKSSRPGDQCHLDEVFLKINGRIRYLWRAVDQDGDVLDILVQSNEIREQPRSFSANC